MEQARPASTLRIRQKRYWNFAEFRLASAGDSLVQTRCLILAFHLSSAEGRPMFPYRPIRDSEPGGNQLGGDFFEVFPEPGLAAVTETIGDEAGDETFVGIMAG